VSFQKSVEPTRLHQQPSIKKVTTVGPHTSQQSDTGLLTCVGIDYPFCKMNIQPPRPIPLPLLLSEWISASLSLKKRRGGVRVGVETETTISVDEAPRSGRPRAHEIEENQNAKRCRNWIRARAG
jgi:hypothetical protein